MPGGDGSDDVVGPGELGEDVLDLLDRAPIALHDEDDADSAQVVAACALGRITPWLFPHLEGAHVGARIRDPRKAWAEACKKAGMPGALFHDLRRSAVRNMEQASVPRSVAVKITGHKTESVYVRYDIVDSGDLKDAAAKMETFFNNKGLTPGNEAMTPLSLGEGL